MRLGFYSRTLAAHRLPSVFKVSLSGTMAERAIRSGPEANSVNSRYNLTAKKQEQQQLWSYSSDAYEKEFPSLSAASSMPRSKRGTRIDSGKAGEQSSQKDVKNISLPKLEAPRTRIDLSMPGEQSSDKEVKNIGPLELEASRTRIDLGTPGEQSSDKEVEHIDPLELEPSRTRIDFGTPGEQSSDKEVENIGSPELEPSRTRIDLGTPGERSSEKEFKSLGPPTLEASTSISHENYTTLPTSFGKKRGPSPSRNRKLHQTYGEAKRISMSYPGTAIDEPFDICLSETRESSPLRSPGNEENRGKWDQKVQSAEENEQHKDNAERNDNILHSIEEIGQVLRPGMVLLKQYMSLSEQVDIVNRCRTLGYGPAGFYRPGFDDGAKLHLHMMCLGLDWNAQTKSYGERRRHDNVSPPHIPNEFTELVLRALDDAHTLIKRDLKTINVEDILPSMSPDVCIVNFYNTTGRLGLHQDRDESRESLVKGLPVVSISVGDSTEFLFGDQRDVNKATKVVLESGDVLIFGGESRHIFHGVKTIIPNTAPPSLRERTKLRHGRLNLTFRKY